MRIALALLLNAGLLALLGPWLRRQWHWAGPGWWRGALVAGLGLRVAVGVARSWPPKLDAEFMSYLARVITGQLWTDPAAAWHTLTDAVVVFPIRNPTGLHLYDAVFSGLSNTWFLAKVLVLLNLGSLETVWVNAFYLSLFAFAGCWQLARKLAAVFPTTPAGAGVVAFLLWPTGWLWATGISKEALLLGSGAWVTARVLGWLYDDAPEGADAKRRGGGWWLGTVLLAAVHFQARYFFAGPLLGVLLGVAVGRWLSWQAPGRHRWGQVVAMVAVLCAGLWLGPKISTAFSLNKFINQVVRVYSYEVEHSAGRPHFDYPDLRPTAESMAAHAPLAAANTLTRPWLGESRQLLYVAAGLENALLLGLLALALGAAVRGRAGHLPFELGLGLAVLCLVLAILMGLTTPNLGSLNRYRSALLPFLLLLLLQNDYAAAGLRRLGLGNGDRKS